MGLDAVVYCDCFERGALKVQPCTKWMVYVDEDGSRASAATELELQLAFDRWNHDRACGHEDGVLLHHWLGNIALVAMLRESVGRQPTEFPLILGKIIYNGTHAGDFLSIEEVAEVQLEVERLSQIATGSHEEEGYLRRFESQLRELADCALRVKKPLVF